MKIWFNYPVSTIVGPISESEMVLRSFSTRILSIWYSYAQYLLTGRLCNRAHGRGRRTDYLCHASTTSSVRATFAQVILETKGTLLKTHKACLIKRVQKCASPYDFHRWRTPPIPDGWQCLIPQVLLTRTLDPGKLHKLWEFSWILNSGESCAEIRIIKYCAEPSVRELP